MGLAAQGFCAFAPTQQSRAWAQAAYTRAAVILRDAPKEAFRHGSTWFVGVDALPNAPDGSLDGVALAGPWQAHIAAPAQWHRAQLSVVFPGYPQKDASESEAAHRFRTLRFGAHIDGLLPEGPQKRRFLREPHGFILGIALDHSQNAPLMVWPGSHLVMGTASDGQNGYLAAQLGSLVPAFRGVVSLVLRRPQLSAMNPYIKPWRAEAG